MLSRLKTGQMCPFLFPENEIKLNKNHIFGNPNQQFRHLTTNFGKKIDNEKVNFFLLALLCL